MGGCLACGCVVKGCHYDFCSLVTVAKTNTPRAGEVNDPRQPCQVTKDRIDSAAARKAVPLFSGVMKYFPDALLALAELSRIGNDQHNPGKPLHWDRSKSGDELDALARHLVDAGTIDTDGVRHSTKVLWRAAANLQKELEAAAKAPAVPWATKGEGKPT